jgi:hypothetical protein
LPGKFISCGGDWLIAKRLRIESQMYDCAQD